MNYLLLATKLIIGFFSMLVLLNLFGNRNLAPTSPTDQIYNYVLGGIIGGAIYNENVSIIQFLIIMIIWASLIKLLDIGKTKSNRIRFLIDGKPLILYEDDNFNEGNLKKANMSVQDFYNKIRMNNISSINDLKFVELQRNGQLLILTRDSPDLGLLLISNGKINPLELKKSKLTRECLELELKNRNINSLTSIYSCEYVDGEFYIKIKN